MSTKYFCFSDGTYITGIGSGAFVRGTEISQAEYTALAEIIANKPPRTETTDYRLRLDLTWEAFALPPDPPDPGPDATAEDYEAALKRLGVEV